METTKRIAMTETISRIKGFLAQVVPDHELRDDEDIITAGYVNSLFAMQIMLFIEKEFQITVEDEDMETENFHTVSAMARLVERKQQQMLATMTDI